MNNSERNQITVFLFAHQDDEMAVCHEIESTILRGGRVICIYLTNGEWDGVISAVRDSETRQVLGKLGVSQNDIHFTGNVTGISSGQLSLNAHEANRHLSELLDQYKIYRLISHSWEGGHEDHDAVHWICAWQALTRSLERKTWHFNLYSSNPSFGLYYRVLAPAADGTDKTVSKIRWTNRLSYLALMLTYRSQAKTMLGLLPFFALHYLIRGTQELHALNVDQLSVRPHSGKLLYEYRGRASFETVANSLKEQLPLP